MLGADAFFDPLERDIDQVLFPFLVPYRFQREPARIGHALRRAGLGGGIGTAAPTEGQSLTELVPDPPLGDLEQPALERAVRRVGFELPDLLGHGNDRLLHYLLGFRVAQAGLDRNAVDQLPVRIEEILPTLAVVPVLQPADKTPAGRNQLIRRFIHWHVQTILPYTRDEASRSFRK